MYGSFFFVRITVNAVKKNFSPQNSTQFLQKFTAFSVFNAKRCGRFAVKKVFFRRYSPLILHYFMSKPRPAHLYFTPKFLKYTLLYSLFMKTFGSPFSLLLFHLCFLITDRWLSSSVSPPWPRLLIYNNEKLLKSEDIESKSSKFTSIKSAIGVPIFTAGKFRFP